jgi:hypothetical protein
VQLGQRRRRVFDSSDFEWNEQANEYRCPAGHALRSQRRPFTTPRTGIAKATPSCIDQASLTARRAR